MSNIETNDLIADLCSEYYADPLGWVMASFDWGIGDLEQFSGPDVWQVKLLTDLGNEITNRGFTGGEPVDPIMMAITSGHGIGKSAMTAWLILFLMSTRPNSKGVVTANTGDQLRTKTWAELAKWKRLCITSDWFEMNSMSIHHKEYPETWRADAQTCREENSEAFAGLHCADSTPWYIFDEAGGIPGKIWEVASGGLTDGEPMHFAFGNPTKTGTEFFNCFNSQKHRWITQEVDSRTAAMTNKKYLQQQIDDFGIDSDRVRVRVLGKFPKAGDSQLIPSDVVAKSMAAGAGQYLGNDPLICGFDVARGGGDDCMIQFRRGRDAVSEKVYRIPGEKSRDSMRVVSILTMLLDRHKPDVTFVDETGIGGPVLDRLVQLGYHCIGVHFGGNADDDKKYANKASEMWYRMRQWLMDGGSIPDETQLENELTWREFDHDKKDRLIIESKKDMKRRGLHSPDWGDALALTFAHHVPERELPRGNLDRHVALRGNHCSSEYDPMDALD